jgi:hypothetical protein
MEQIAADHFAGKLFGFVAPGERHGEDPGGAKFFERGALGFPVAQVLPRDGEDRELLGSLVDHHHAVGLAEGERTEQDGVEDAEDGGVATDAERESENCDGGEDFGAAQLADGELQISKQAQDYLAGGADAALTWGGIAHLWASLSYGRKTKAEFWGEMRASEDERGAVTVPALGEDLYCRSCVDMLLVWLCGVRQRVQRVSGKALRESTQRRKLALRRFLMERMWSC